MRGSEPVDCGVVPDSCDDSDGCGVGVALRVSNHGSAAATVTLSVPSHPTVKVAPGAGGTVQTGGLKDGTYRILVNGTPRGQLMIGAQGGP